MDIIKCPKCSVRVAIFADGTCPSCLTQLDGGKSSHSEVVPQTESGTTATDASFRETRDPSNAKTETQVDDRATHFDLLWILFSLRGRIPRSIFWAASVLGPLLFLVIWGIAISALGDSSIVGLVSLVLLFAFIWSALAVGVKRLHDLGMSGWWMILGFLPGIGQVFMSFYVGLQKGTRGPNRFGIDPLTLFDLNGRTRACT
ncbi:DUF805 domain-containing protein [Novipirellula artificiosorum]|uniref:Inner membrane protein YhaH n=1 Tax=Novipirellula artificiosorum TaxID=2528016 RepID=A0A5C6DVA3_9BACT|nr:Inner membrane protein YhaH [Novipirellula artificiosorum]